jgi:hypothetical protein
MCIEREHRRPRAGLVLCAVASLLSVAVGCRLTSADEVQRTPNIVRGSGGSGGRDLAESQDGVPDEPGPADAPAIPDVALPSAADRYDAVLDLGGIDSPSEIDGIASALDSTDAGDTRAVCIEEDSGVCDDSDGDPQDRISTEAGRTGQDEEDRIRASP